LREPDGRKDQLHCRYEDFTADVPCNQVPKATAELVLRSPLLSEGVRSALRQALDAFAGIQSTALDAASLAVAVPDALTEAYRPLLDLCRLVAEGLAAGQAAGTTSCPAFLLDLERVFERYLTQGMVRAFPASGRLDVAVQQLYCANQPVAGQPDLHLRPDLTVHCGERAVLVIDAKWKRLQGTPLVTEDLYQVLAYCTALQARRAMLVYPGRRDRVWKYKLARVPVCVAIHTLRVTGSREECARSLRRLGQAARRFAQA
jgi:5-methylcytosine-specific restriction enzyme subunit McrC